MGRGGRGRGGRNRREEDEEREEVRGKRKNRITVVADAVQCLVLETTLQTTSDTLVIL